MEEQKKENEALREQLLYRQKNGYDLIDTAERLALEDYCNGYKAFLDAARTEREAVREAITQAEARGFVPFTPGMAIQPGMKLYRSNRGKALLLAVIGEQPLSDGCTVVAAHVDSPRLDLKQLPLYEAGEMAYFKTH
ncbi:MAG: aminopeptidase, partial [Oscillospiraceae bacterium]|nr:aminopeptidase [Oscillospiraceae bacterium]